jgi:hypothetical protein
MPATASRRLNEYCGMDYNLCIARHARYPMFSLPLVQRGWCPRPPDQRRIPQHHVVVRNFDSVLLCYAEAGLTKLVNPDILVDLIEKGASERIHDVKRAPDDAIDEPVRHDVIQYICGFQCRR